MNNNNRIANIAIIIIIVVRTFFESLDVCRYDFFIFLLNLV